VQWFSNEKELKIRQKSIKISSKSFKCDASVVVLPILIFSLPSLRPRSPNSTTKSREANKHCGA